MADRPGGPETKPWLPARHIIEAGRYPLTEGAEDFTRSIDLGFYPKTIYEMSINEVRELSRKKWVKERAEPLKVISGGTLLDPLTLTIGFPRRFATYKRAYLIFSDLERLKRLLNNRWRPVQIIFAGLLRSGCRRCSSRLGKINGRAYKKRGSGIQCTTDGERVCTKVLQECTERNLNIKPFYLTKK